MNTKDGKIIPTSIFECYHCQGRAFTLELGKCTVPSEEGYLIIYLCDECGEQGGALGIRDETAEMILRGEKESIDYDLNH